MPYILKINNISGGELLLETNDSRTETIFSYIIGLFVGIVFTGYVMTVPSILGFGGVWQAPTGDLAQNLTGHLAFQASPWGWPILRASNLFTPHGLSIAMTDSNPLMSIVAKIIDVVTTKQRNFLGFWCAACLILQPIAAIYAIRGFSVRHIETSIAAAIFSICFPAFLARVGHINLLGHFYLLVALGIAVRDTRLTAKVMTRSYIGRFILLLCAILSHPYLFVFSAMLLSSRMWNAIFNRTVEWKREVLCYFSLVILVASSDFILSQTFGSADIGFGYYSMNLLSPIWPSRSWLFQNIPMMDATGGQYEGYNYLGAGAIIAVIFGFFSIEKIQWRNWGGLVFVLISLFLLSVSTVVYCGHSMIFSLGQKPWGQVFGFIQSSGRAFWIVGYFITILALARLEFFPRKFSFFLVAGLTVLQLFDTSLLRLDARKFFAGTENDQMTIDVALGHAQLTNAIPCSKANDAAAGALALNAIRSGGTLTYIRAARSPTWFNCDVGTSDSTELPIAEHEIRAFDLQNGMPPIYQSVFLSGATCTFSSPFLLCGLNPPAGIVRLPKTLPIPQIIQNQILNVAQLPLGYGWVRDNANGAWSEGPRSSLLFTMPEGKFRSNASQFKIFLNLQGIGFRKGLDRKVVVTVDRARSQVFSLPDERPVQIILTIKNSALFGGKFARVTFDTHFPVNPEKRHINSPVNRAAILLTSMEVD